MKEGYYMRIGTGIYVKNSLEAVDFYIKAFGLNLGHNVKNEDGSYYHSELYKDDEHIFSVVEGKGSEEESIIQLSIEFDSSDEVKRVYDTFCNDGATVDMPIGELPWSSCAASVVDRFGVWWYFSSLSHIPADDFDPKKPLR